MTAAWDGLTLMPYRTIVADPPWHYDQPYPQAPWNAADAGALPYSSMTLDEIRGLPVADLGNDSRCFLWTTNRHLRHAWSVLEAWGYEPQNRVLVWCKPPRALKTVTTEFVLIGKRGKPQPMPWHGTTWFNWSVTPGHSRKPEAFLDLVESWCEGPYLELFCRNPRFGWDAWGYGYETAEIPRGWGSIVTPYQLDLFETIPAVLVQQVARSPIQAEDGGASPTARLHLHSGDIAAARGLVMDYHYSRRWPSAVALVVTWHLDGGLFGDSGEPIAACVFGQPATSGWSEPVLELTRLVRHPDHVVALSKLIGFAVRVVRARRLADLVVSMADAGEGHHGGIYQASSWRYNGQRATRMDGVIHNGAFVPGRTANALWGTQSPTLLAANGIDVDAHYDIGKHLYWKPLNRDGAKKAQRLGLLSVSYPKPEREISLAAAAGGAS